MGSEIKGKKWGGIWDLRPAESRGIGISSAARGSGIKFSDRKSNIYHKMTKFSIFGRKELPPFTNSNVFLR